MASIAYSIFSLLNVFCVFSLASSSLKTYLSLFVGLQNKYFKFTKRCFQCIWWSPKQIFVLANNSFW